ncbi:MAG: bifunctional heptose 7-phosphate kinase/heptose 1-phosphate adenyltransferase [Planctomycetota bacterium]
MPKSLIHLVDRWQPKRIVVAGDFMLDRYAYGDADRLSPDAPVPVLAVKRTEDKPGGSANVGLCLAALQCEVTALGVIGDDDTGKALRSAMDAAGIDTAGLIADADRPTTLKHSLVGLAQHRHPQKMFRIDVEDKSPISTDTADRLLDAAQAALDQADALILEDYNKGVLTERVCQGLIARAKERGVPVYVDPASIDDYRKYRGATCITPNRTEAERATGMDSADPAALAKSLLASIDLDYAILTLDKQGALLLGRDGDPLTVPTVARQVYDVTGAGDMVIAMLAAALANGAAWRQAVELANVAAGLEVERFGVVPIQLGEVLLSLLELRGHRLGKVRSVDDLLPELAAHRAAGKSIAFTNGCFDILHAGHVQYLRQAKSTADLLVVALNGDDSITRLKGAGRPVNHLDDRLMVMSELASIDYLLVFDEDTPTKLIEAIKPEKLIKGGDYKNKEDVVGWEIVEQYGGDIVLVGEVEGRSTTNILKQIGEE